MPMQASQDVTPQSELLTTAPSSENIVKYNFDKLKIMVEAFKFEGEILKEITEPLKSNNQDSISHISREYFTEFNKIGEEISKRVRIAPLRCGDKVLLRTVKSFAKLFEKNQVAVTRENIGTLITRTNELTSLLLELYQRVHPQELADAKDGSDWENRMPTRLQSASQRYYDSSDSDLQSEPETSMPEAMQDPYRNTNVQVVTGTACGAELAEIRCGSKRVIKLLSDPQSGSLLEKFELKSGDLITAINHNEIRNIKNLTTLSKDIRGKVVIRFRDFRGIFLERHRDITWSTPASEHPEHKGSSTRGQSTRDDSDSD
jgi:hypothetical protein